MFFVLSGAELNLGILKIVGLLGFIYIISRVCGKIFGAWFGGKITKAETKITKYLGFALDSSGRSGYRSKFGRDPGIKSGHGDEYQGNRPRGDAYL